MSEHINTCVISHKKNNPTLLWEVGAISEKILQSLPDTLSYGLYVTLLKKKFNDYLQSINQLREQYNYYFLEKDYINRLLLNPTQIEKIVKEIKEYPLIQEAYKNISELIMDHPHSEFQETLLDEYISELAYESPLMEKIGFQKPQGYGMFQIQELLTNTPEILENFTYLDLEGFALHSWTRENVIGLFQHLHGLKSLTMKRNILFWMESQGLIGLLGNLPQLHHLCMKDTTLSNISHQGIEYIFTTFQKLKYLNIEECELGNASDEILKIIGEKIGTLKGINLSNNQLGDLSMRKWELISQNFKTLQSLKIGRNSFSLIDEKSKLQQVFASFEGVQHFDCAFDNFGSIDDEMITLLFTPLLSAQRIKMNVFPFQKELLKLYPILRDRLIIE